VGVPGLGFNQLLGVNDHGDATGYYQYGSSNTAQPFTRTSGGAFRLPPIPNSQMTDMNNGGNFTGFQMLGSHQSRAFVVVGSSVHYFEYPGSRFTQANGLNNRGMVVGMY